jgi:two-component system nitrogen regulation sensor histidine kinase NtrY
VKRVGFRGRLFLILLAFALIPTIVISSAWSTMGAWLLSMAGASAAWESAAKSGQRALDVARRDSVTLTPDQRQALVAHDSTLREGVLNSRRAEFVFSAAAKRLAVATVFAVLLLGLVASQVAGHLSRNLSRPLQELVSWTERIGRGEVLPDTPPQRGAPEFAVLRQHMRQMSSELQLGRARALEAERGAALRETARQVAHELKNPLTPIRFAVERLRREAPPSLADTVDVLAVESRRIEELARSFAQFGRLPEGPRAAVDLGELARYTARATVPDGMPVDVDVDADVPMVLGHHDALARALSNVMLNAVDACRALNGNGRVSVRVKRTALAGRDGVEVAVADTGCGIAGEQLARIWDPYVTTKPGGTGLGLAITRQTIVAHDGTVAAQSAPGTGTTIRIVLPVGAHQESTQ